MADRRRVRTIRDYDDYDDELADDELADAVDDELADDELADSGDDELADRDAALTAAQAARVALRHIAELTGKQPEGVAGVEPTEDGWAVAVEVVEDRRIPSSSDILATYEAGLDPGGKLLSCHRVGRYLRGRGDRGV
ncbi:MAG TPA: gas vesicle protein GvpO [Trebonia sp.]|jgi:hypothetical protein